MAIMTEVCAQGFLQVMKTGKSWLKKCVSHVNPKRGTGKINGYLSVRVVKIDPGQKGKTKLVNKILVTEWKLLPTVILKMELVNKHAPGKVLIEWEERLCHEGDTISMVGPEVRIPFKLT